MCKYMSIKTFQLSINSYDENYEISNYNQLTAHQDGVNDAFVVFLYKNEIIRIGKDSLKILYKAFIEE